MTRADTILIAVRDDCLADSLRFSLELEGFETRFCDERSLSPSQPPPCLEAGCLVVDQEVFSCVEQDSRPLVPAGSRMPVILIVSQKTERLLRRAKAGGVTEILEKPILGGLMLETIRHVMAQKPIAAGGPAVESMPPPRAGTIGRRPAGST